MRTGHQVTAHIDDRGAIADIITNFPCEHVALVGFTQKGDRRGDHVHKETTQLAYICRGSVEVRTQGEDLFIIKSYLMTGDYIIHEPGESHAFIAQEGTLMLVLTHGPRGGDNYESDTFRLEQPL